MYDMDNVYTSTCTHLVTKMHNLVLCIHRLFVLNLALGLWSTFPCHRCSHEHRSGHGPPPDKVVSIKPHFQNRIGVIGLPESSDKDDLARASKVL